MKFRGLYTKIIKEHFNKNNEIILLCFGAADGYTIKITQNILKNTHVNAVSVEPLKDWVPLLELIDHNKIYNCALVCSDEKDEVCFYETENRYSSSLFKPEEHKDKYLVSTITIEAILKTIDKNIDIITMDIQGSEETIIPDAIDLLNNCTELLVINTHSKKIDSKILNTLHSNNWSLLAYYPYPKKELEHISPDGEQYWINNRKLRGNHV